MHFNIAYLTKRIVFVSMTPSLYHHDFFDGDAMSNMCVGVAKVAPESYDILIFKPFSINEGIFRYNDYKTSIKKVSY